MRKTAKWDWARRLHLTPRTYQEHFIFNYDRVVANMLAAPEPAYRRFPTVTPFWDNSARRKTAAYILAYSTPEAYERWLRAVLARPAPFSQKVVFINAWNEWAEGCHLEPDLRHGHAYLEATRRALLGA
jgi:hypothetical protein